MSHCLIIPTYKRIDDLIRTLNSVVNQFVKPSEVLVIIGPNDIDSFNLAKGYANQISNLFVMYAQKPSLINALNIGINRTQCDIVTLTDDDVLLPVEWLGNIKNYFENNPEVGVYGGPDKLQIFGNIYIDTQNPVKKVGAFTLFGLIGYHHCGIIQSPAEVDIIKGVNLSFRKKALNGTEIDNYLESSGAELCSEIDICMKIKRNGYKIIYDNDNYLIHFASKRIGDDNRTDLFSKSIFFRVRNYSYVYAKYRPILEIILFVIRDFAVGTREQPGLIRSLTYIKKSGLKVITLPFIRMRPMFIGIVKGFEKRKHLNIPSS